MAPSKDQRSCWQSSVEGAARRTYGQGVQDGCWIGPQPARPKEREAMTTRRITRTVTQRVRVPRPGGGTRTIPVRIKRTVTLTTRRVR